MKIAFLWPFDKANMIFDNWRDGHKAAVKRLSKYHKVDWYLGNQCTKSIEGYDWIIIWDDGSFGRPQTDSKVALMLTTENTIGDHLKDYDVVFCESEPIKDKVRRLGVRAIKAMGTDTSFFKPNKKVVKDIEHFYPATFSPWKKQSNVAFLGPKLLCVGTLQPDGHNELLAVTQNGCRVITKYLPATRILNYYQRAKSVVIPAIHGSERTVLESMSVGIVPDVNRNNIKAYSYVREFHASNYENPRDFVLKNYSHSTYCDALRKGIEQ